MSISAAIALGLGCTATGPRGAEGALGDGQCEPTISTLYAGRTIDAGTVSVSNTSTELVIRVTATGDWRIEGMHVYAGTGPVPTNPAGNVAPGRFPHHVDLSPAVSTTELRIPRVDLGATCDTVLTIAVHVELSRVLDGGAVQSESAWGFRHRVHRSPVGLVLDGEDLLLDRVHADPGLLEDARRGLAGLEPRARRGDVHRSAVPRAARHPAAR